MVLGKLPVPGRPTNLDQSGARAYCACSRCGWVCLDIFFLSSVISLFFLPLWETARYRLKYRLKGPLNPKQPTNQPIENECKTFKRIFSLWLKFKVRYKTHLYQYKACFNK